MSGLLVAVVGPSGVGKDTLIEALAQVRPDIVAVQRVITRAADAGGEEHLAVTDDAFGAQMSQGRFAFHWKAHGMRYAIPASITDDLAQGRVVVFNGSRKALPEIMHAYPRILVLMISASREVLAERLRARGREDASEIAARLSRADLEPPEGTVTIVNDGKLDAALAQMLAAINRAMARA